MNKNKKFYNLKHIYNAGKTIFR